MEPLEHGSNQVMVKAREELVEHIGHSEPKIVSDQNVALLARQLALHANVSIKMPSVAHYCGYKLGNLKGH